MTTAGINELAADNLQNRASSIPRDPSTQTQRVVLLHATRALQETGVIRGATGAEAEL